MKLVKHLTVAAILLSAVSAIGCAQSASVGSQSTASGPIPDRPDALGLESVKFDLPKTDRYVLENGLVVYYRFDDELPRIAGTIFFPGGKLTETADTAGFSAATGAQLREGATIGMSPEELDRTLDRLAASIETSYDMENGALGFHCLTEDFDKVFDLSSRVLLRPAFDARRLELWKKISIDNIRRRRDDPGTMAGLSLARLVYGADSPFSRVSTEASIRRINRDALKAYADRYIRPNGAILAASGAIPPEDFRRAVEKYFGGWKRNDDPLPGLPQVAPQNTAGVYVLERDFDQATVLMGHLGPPRFTPDVYEMNIYNRILGSSGFGSRLFDEIRTQLGLAYDVDASISPGVVAGMFQLYLGTRNEEVVRAIKTSLEITRDTLSTPPDGGHFQDAKSAVERSFIFRFEGDRAIVQRAAQQELLKFPPDYDRTYLERVAKVTPEMVRDVGKRWVKPDELAIVVIGRVSAEKLAESLRAAGVTTKVYRLDFDVEPRVLGEVR